MLPSDSEVRQTACKSDVTGVKLSCSSYLLGQDLLWVEPACALCHPVQIRRAQRIVEHVLYDMWSCCATGSHSA